MEETYDRNDLTEGVIWKKFLSFFFPILFGLLFQQLYSTADGIIVGKFIGTDALAAVGGSTVQIINLITGFFTGLATGATVIVSQYYGARDNENVSKTVHTIITFYLIVGAAITALGYFFAPQLLVLCKNPEDIMDLSVTYLRIYFLGTIPNLIFNVGSGILRAVGDSRRPTGFLVCCCVINVILDLYFIINLKMGVAGAAWATIIAQFISGALVMLNMLRTPRAHRIYPSKLGIDGYALRDALWIGIPSGVQSTMYSLSNLLIQVAVNSLGTAVIASWAAVGKLDGLYWVMSNSFGAAICAMVGQCFGAGKIDRMKECVRVVMKISLCCTVVASGLLLYFAEPGFHIISNDPEVIDYSVEMMWIFAPFYIVWTFIEIISNTLRGVGDTIRPTIIIMIGVCLLRVIWVYCVFPLIPTVFGISVSYDVTWTVTAISLIIYYLRSDWLGRCTSLKFKKEAGLPER